MEKEKKLKKFLLAMLLGIFWYLIHCALDTILGISMVLCCIHPYETTIIIGYMMIVLLIYFHKLTNGAWMGYLECGFLLTFCIVGGWCGYIIFTDTENHEFLNIIVWECKLMPVCLLAMFLSSVFYKNKQKQEKRKKIEIINKSIVISMLGVFSYLSFTVMGSFMFSFELMMVIAPIIIIPYIIIVQMILKKEYRWRLLFANIIIFILIFLNACLIDAVGSFGLDAYDLMNLAMASIPYGISVAIGELIVWLSDKRKDSRLAKQVAGNSESKGDV
ncbi:MAG: hypothetical protein HDR01_12780 [Lachnospiraceae bacterium]|nr:hypothetical protein [Lachnospiraceae bacterium]